MVEFLDTQYSWEDVPRFFSGEPVAGYRDALRHTCRGIIVLGRDRLLMTTTRQYGEFVFAGGGAEGDESDLATLAREVREETGYEVLPQTCMPFAYVEEIRVRADKQLNMRMASKFFLCRAEMAGEPCLDEREALTGLAPCEVSIADALAANAALLAEKRLFWVARDQEILKMLPDSDVYRTWCATWLP